MKNKKEKDGKIQGKTRQKEKRIFFVWPRRQAEGGCLTNRQIDAGVQSEGGHHVVAVFPVDVVAVSVPAIGAFAFTKPTGEGLKGKEIIERKKIKKEI